MPLRTLLILIALAVVVLAIKRLFSPPRPRTDRQLKQGKMVQCAHCGIYLPESEAITREGRPYCSQAHLDDDRDPPQE
jgi:uncharacterized protein